MHGKYAAHGQTRSSRAAWASGWRAVADTAHRPAASVFISESKEPAFKARRLKRPADGAAERLGLGGGEQAFYDALAAMGDDKELSVIAAELITQTRRSVTTGRPADRPLRE